MPEEQVKGTFPYIAPEIVAKRPYNELSDVYSYGMVIWNILTRKHPAHLLSKKEKEEMALTQVYQPEIPHWCPQEFVNLIKNCWLENPVDRFSFNQITRYILSNPTSPPIIPDENK